MQQNVQQENKMGVMPINKLLITMSVPMMLSMLVQALYNIVDSIFVSRVSENALTAVSLAFPIQMLMISLGVGIGVGINAVLSRSLGEKNQQKVNAAATQGLFLIVISYIFFALVGLFASRALIAAQTDIPDIVEHGTIYLTICCTASFGIFAQFTFERLLQSTGKTFYTMITQLAGAITNLILDPILIFGLLGMPKMGVAGAATATVIGQIVSGTVALILHMRLNKEVQIKIRGFRPDLPVIKELLAVGIPSTIMQAIGSVMTLGMNKILISYSSTAVAVFGVYFKLQSFIFMPVFGLNNGMVPIIAYNYGAANKKRLVKTVKLSVLYSVVIMLIGLFIMQIMPDTLLKLFDASDTMLEIGVPALRMISLSFLFAGYCIIISSVFQALGNGVYSMIISITRQLIVLLPSAYILSKVGGLSLVWWSFPIAEIASVTVCTIFLFKINKKVISKLP